MKVLHINASARDEKSQSLRLADVFIDEFRKKRNDIIIDRFNLFHDELPEFGAIASGAKMALFTGTEQTAEQKSVWDNARAVFDRFAEADVYVFNIPLWNNGMPYILKQFIDVVTQPGWAFGFDMEKGYTGLLTNKKAFVVHASGVYREGIAPNFGSDFSSPYFRDWLNFVGVEDIHEVKFMPTVVNNDIENTYLTAEKETKALISHF